MNSSIRRFPDGFLFGAATAAYQIEGAAFEDGRTASIWDAFARVPGAVQNGETGDVACDHYHRYRDDVRLMGELGLQTYRFSTSWARVRPDGGPANPAGLAFYDRLVDELLAGGIVPWLTLYHWDLPHALEETGGWTSRDTVDRFVEYALSVHDALGDRVTHWTTLNEPWCSSFLSYTAGVHAPGRTSVEDGILAAHHLLLGHGRAIRALRERDPGLDLGITLNLTVADPADARDPDDADAARRIDGQFNRWFLDPLFRGEYPADVVDDIRAVDPLAVRRWADAVQDGDLETIATPLDCLGINYYHGELLSGTPQPGAEGTPHDGGADGGNARLTRSPFPAADDVHWVERGLPRTGMDWEVQPEGLTRVLRRIGTEYAPGIPLYVTENGAAYDDVAEAGGVVHDAERAMFLREHIAATHDAIEEGVDVRGYFAWSLLDNYEWSFGYGKRFGIVRVDYDTQRRIVKDSGREYARIIAARAV
ncbi:glycoside hydrolase family 1 protein [Microbacterium sp. ASV81]|uniref:beta-glucosidase n=1 Tax=Microbacterium capsulatum TaxID=3041921 RepID=A0ABU0XMM3_9MICO|nr:family 1 glycosylhydrolase [Microbacterium sp. ASV81]MDQ4214985.1 family 1 glycosylhydrolase [Microbacterium sp. ASV81]